MTPSCAASSQRSSVPRNVRSNCNKELVREDVYVSSQRTRFLALRAADLPPRLPIGELSPALTPIKLFGVLLRPHCFSSDLLSRQLTAVHKCLCPRVCVCACVTFSMLCSPSPPADLPLNFGRGVFKDSATGLFLFRAAEILCSFSSVQLVGFLFCA